MLLSSCIWCDCLGYATLPTEVLTDQFEKLRRWFGHCLSMCIGIVMMV